MGPVRQSANPYVRTFRLRVGKNLIVVGSLSLQHGALTRGGAVLLP